MKLLDKKIAVRYLKNAALIAAAVSSWWHRKTGENFIVRLGFCKFLSEVSWHV